VRLIKEREEEEEQKNKWLDVFENDMMRAGVSVEDVALS